jgi:hypothetical protein
MKKGSKEMLRTILSYQELIMKALKIEIPAAVTEKKTAKKAVVRKAVVNRKAK